MKTLLLPKKSITLNCVSSTSWNVKLCENEPPFPKFAFSSILSLSKLYISDKRNEFFSTVLGKGIDKYDVKSSAFIE